MADISIIIRAYNEAPELRRLLAVLSKQDFAGSVELIVVDNGSTDDSVAVAKQFRAIIVKLPQEEFSYPRSLNVGIRRASSPIVACLVAHAYPDDSDWLRAGYRHFADAKVGGVYAFTKPHLDAPIWDKMFTLSLLWAQLRGIVSIHQAKHGGGVFGATNIALRRSLWEAHPFDEAYGAGGEDNEWAAWALDQGYKILRDPAFTVRHSHYLKSFSQFVKQLRLWRRTDVARPFEAEDIAFRKRLP